MNKEQNKNMIIYSLAVMEKLVENGHFPIQTMPNPKYPQYNCWVFKVDDDFMRDFVEAQRR